MAPVEPEVANSNTVPLIRLSVYVSTALTLTGWLCYNTYGAYRSLPPSQQTRLRSSSRRKHVAIFTILTAGSLVQKWYHMLSYLVLSYRAWADEMDIPFSETLYGDRGLFSKNGHSLMLGRWLQDISPWDDFFEITLEKSRRYWWTQQLFLAAAVFSVFLGVEGQRRRIRHLWAYMLLGETVGVSFALNLFFLAILFAPIPLNEGEATATSALEGALARSRASVAAYVAKINTYLPVPLSLLPLLAILTTIVLLPFSASTPSFNTTILIRNISLFLTVYTNPAPSNTPTQPIFSALSLASLVLHIQRLQIAFLSPLSTQNRHSTYLSKLYLYTSRPSRPAPSTASHRLLSAFQDHPAAALVNWDIVLTAASLVTWSVLRGLDVDKILSIVTFGFYPSSLAGESALSAADKDAVPMSPSAMRRSTRTKRSTAKARASTTTANSHAYSDSDSDDEREFSSGAGEAEFQGEEEKDENLEAGAVGLGVLPMLGLGGLAAAVLGAEGL
ncbi:MAG: hypothetical protein Q9227_000601 [Pyrenula ochraceoflavens]